MFKKKNDTVEQADQPKSKKKLKWILLAVAVVLLFVFIFGGSSDDSDRTIPTLEDNMSEYLELYTAEKTDGVTMEWYKIEPDDISHIGDYVELLCNDYDFVTVDGEDNDYYLYYTAENELATLYTDNGNKEYHIRIGIGDENEDQSLIAFVYVDGLFDDDENIDDNTDEAKESADTYSEKEEEKTEQTTERGKDVVLASAIKGNSATGQKPGKNSVKFQSMFDYFSEGFTFKEATQSGLSYVQKFEASEDDEDAVAAYINFLCSDGMNFRKADDYYKDYRGMSTANSKTVFASWGLTYTGTAKVEQKCDTAFLDEAKYALTIYYTIEYGEIEGTIEWSVSLDSCDLGFRSGGKVANTAPGGKSALTGLMRTGDGIYKTTDGRFSAGLNEAVIIKNGKNQKGTLEYQDNSDKAGHTLKIKDASSNKLFAVVFPCGGVQKTGQLYNYKDLLQEYQFPLSGDPYGDRGEDLELHQYIGKKWLTATYSNSPCKDMTLRVMYYSEAEQVAVYYIYAEFTEETEAFCVVDLSKAKKADSQSSSGGSGSSVPTLNSGTSVCAFCKNKGKTFCNRCNGTGRIVVSGSIAGFGTDNDKQFTQHKGDCPECENGYKDCPYCN